MGTFAEEMELSRNTVSNIVNGKSQPSYSVLTRIIQTLKLSSDELIEILFSDCLESEK